MPSRRAADLKEGAAPIVTLLAMLVLSLSAGACGARQSSRATDGAGGATVIDGAGGGAPASAAAGGSVGTGGVPGTGGDRGGGGEAGGAGGLSGAGGVAAGTGGVTPPAPQLSDFDWWRSVEGPGDGRPCCRTWRLSKDRQLAIDWQWATRTSATLSEADFESISALLMAPELRAALASGSCPSPEREVESMHLGLVGETTGTVFSHCFTAAPVEAVRARIHALVRAYLPSTCATPGSYIEPYIDACGGG